MVIDADEPAAYCVAGRSPAVVVTSAALDRLDSRQLAAVLAHETAHLAGRHHELLLVLRALAGGLSRLPLFVAAADAVALLLEMCADDAAARRHGWRPLLEGLLALAGRQRTASAALGAADLAVVARAQRLVSPAPRGARWRHRVLLTGVMVLALLIPMALALVCRL